MLYMAAAVVFLGLLLHWSLPDLVLVYICSFIFNGLMIAAMAKRRSGKQRLCTTTVSEEGLLDITPDTSKFFSWRQIGKVELSAGDIYFSTKTAGCFIPRSAFASPEDAKQYYLCADNLWRQGRNKKIGTSSQDLSSVVQRLQSQAEIDQILAEDESVWLDLEKEHEKQKSQPEKDL